MSLKSRELLKLYREGESEAAREIFDRYVARLVALAGSRVGRKLQRRIDAEDVVQSAYRSFFVHAKVGEYQWNKSGDLWRLLAKITLHKLYGQVERQTAEKRSIAREVEAELSAGTLTAPEPTPDEAVAVVEQLQRILDSLSESEREVLSVSLQGQTVEQISNTMDRSARTTRRLLASAKRKIEQRLLATDKTSGQPSPTIVDAEAPLQHADFVLERLVGSGGMGKVFRAKEQRIGKTVAIKALHKSRQADSRAVAQFVQEAQILAKLRHTNIVGVHGLGRFPGGGYFMVMEFIDGVDLRTRLRNGPLALSEGATIMKQVASGVHYAHEQGIVHCDLKPENVLLDGTGLAIVTDFGFAFIVTGASAAGSVGGTPGYIAPEILRHTSQPTPAADIYGLGMLMWTLLTNQPPARLSSDGLDAAANSIIRRCVAERPADRYQSADEFIHALAILKRD